mgnify:CR=1 FL=1
MSDTPNSKFYIKRLINGNTIMYLSKSENAKLNRKRSKRIKNKIIYGYNTGK